MQIYNVKVENIFSKVNAKITICHSEQQDK